MTGDAPGAARRGPPRRPVPHPARAAVPALPAPLSAPRHHPGRHHRHRVPPRRPPPSPRRRSSPFPTSRGTTSGAGAPTSATVARPSWTTTARSATPPSSSATRTASSRNCAGSPRAPSCCVNAARSPPPNSPPPPGRWTSPSPSPTPARARHLRQPRHQRAPRRRPTAASSGGPPRRARPRGSSPTDLSARAACTARRRLARAGRRRWTLVFAGATDATRHDPWFVRTGSTRGWGPRWPTTGGRRPGGTLVRRMVTVVADGRLDRDGAAALVRKAVGPDDPDPGPRDSATATTATPC